ncbi:two-component system OmpR family response regulator [Sphaerotilus hippei]|uniref:Two-component system OmpR family response regulator n=1 Tax=Sphaerotilus hippei TaxID=744406 RepID=A0A318H935_9BURK|nr:response regulator transcription factor [Sphaerotilus hippei]PXW99438.1 two-component system OmpR family response regulator [Sphaerotilus hippei]
MRLLLLEDDTTLGEGLAAFLRSEGHLVDWFTRLAQVRTLGAEPYDTLLVDWQLPDGSGLDWIASLRRHGNVTPIVVLTARDLIRDRIQGLDSGADDYLVKPFDPEELAARVRALGRRWSGLAGHRRRIGPVEVDLTAKAVWHDGRAVDLTAREWTLLEALLLRSGRIVAKSDLESLVHGFQSEHVSNTLEVHVSSLRRKLGRELIETVRGLGYRIGT